MAYKPEPLDTAQNAPLGDAGQFAERLAGDDVPALLGFWRGHDPAAWAKTPDAYRLLAERLRAVGEPLLAFDVADEALAIWPEDLRLRQIHGLALADSGATERANDAFERLASEGHDDEETLGMLARTHKDLWARACDATEKDRHLRLAQACYESAYRRTRGYWTGINAATLAALRGSASAAALAREVFERGLTDLRHVEQHGGDGYWPLATLGEACLVMQRWDEAEQWYGEAAQVGRGRAGDLSSTRRNARLLLALPGVPENASARIEASFRLPRVVMFAGHLVDRPDRSPPRFPPELEPDVARAIRDRLQAEAAPPIGIGSAACGSDLLFMEAVLDLGGEINVVLPYEADQFVADSVDLLPGSGWSARFRHMLGRAARVVVASERCQTASPPVYDYANRMVHGLARIRADQLDTELRGLAVWDGSVGDGPGGTGEQVRAWQEGGVAIEIIDLRNLLTQRGRRVEPGDVKGAPSASLLAKGRGRRRGRPEAMALGGEALTAVKAMLFADAAGFSKLSDEQVPGFVNRFLGTVGALCRGAKAPPIMGNTWGDGLFFVFDTPAAAGHFALDLCEIISATNWASFGLPADLSLRIGLHAGPVYEHVDPITGRTNFSGAHVSRAARIEPITPPGQVYASEPFAALCAAEGDCDLVCDYVGQTPLAKGYGTFRSYHVRRRPC